MSPIAYARRPRGIQPGARRNRIVSAEAAIGRGPLKVVIAAASSAARMPRRRRERITRWLACFFFSQSC
jgi:hypothetical protein